MPYLVGNALSRCFSAGAVPAQETVHGIQHELRRDLAGSGAEVKELSSRARAEPGKAARSRRAGELPVAACPKLGKSAGLDGVVKLFNCIAAPGPSPDFSHSYEIGIRRLPARWASVMGLRMILARVACDLWGIPTLGGSAT